MGYVKDEGQRSVKEEEVVGKGRTIYNGKGEAGA
jgi:hypothetical protein